MAADERWYFTKEEILNSPSRKCGIDAEKELSYRQQGAKLIQDMGQRLQVTQLVINTAIVYMHRFYMFHPFTKFHRNCISPAALFLAAKVEEQPRKLEHVIKVAHYILCHHEHANLDVQSETYQEKAQELVMNENILLQTLGFDVAIDHPHTHVVKCFQMVRSKCSCPTATTELAQTSYFMATNSLHMTTMCLQYRPSVVACVCIYIVCKWSNYEDIENDTQRIYSNRLFKKIIGNILPRVPDSNASREFISIQRFTEGKDWFAHVDPTVTLEMLELLTSEFLTVLDKYPSRLKKLMNSGPHAGPSTNNLGEERAARHNNVPVNTRPQPQGGGSSTQRVHELGKPGVSKPIVSLPPTPQKTVLSHKEYSEKREKERREREKERERAAPIIPTSSSHHSASAHLSVAPHMSSSHQRPQPSDNLIRKPHSDPSRINIPSSSIRATFKEPIPKRDVISIRSDDKVIQEERTSVNNLESNSKFISEKLKNSSESRHSIDWNQSRQLEFINKDRKDIKLENKSDIKQIIKEKVINESREHIKSDVYSKHYDTSNKNIIKSEPSVVKIKTDKSEHKEEVKVQGVREVKHNNSFIFNNNDFSLRDFLNPSEMPPDDIFDTEVDTKPPLFNSADFLPTETTHHKLNSPPRHQLGAATSNPSSSHSSTVTNSAAAVKGAATTTTTTTNHSKPPVEPVQTSVVEAKPSRHLNSNTAPTNNVNIHGNHGSEKNNIGNGLPNVHNITSNTPHTLQTPSVRRKEKDPSPQSIVSQASTAKVKLQRLESTVLPPSIKFEDRRHIPTKDLKSPLKHSLQKDAVITAHLATTLATTTSTPPPLKSGTTTIQSQQLSYTPVKAIPEHLKPDNLHIRLPRPESCDSVSIVTTANSASSLSTNSSSVALESSLKSLKQEHRHKPRKEKKKHRHKEKDKHKEKESKEHKKKHKKKDKERDKEREKDKDKDKEKKSEKQSQKDSSRPLKITIMRGKGVCTPDVATTNASNTPALPIPVQEKESTSSASWDTPGRIKLTIPKSRLQVNASSGVQLSPPRGIPPKETAATKVKLKIPRDTLKPEKDRENRKRERERSPENNHAAKISRTSSYNAPQVGNDYPLPHSTVIKKTFKNKHARQSTSQHVHQYPPPPSQSQSNPRFSQPCFNPPRLDQPVPPTSYQHPPSYPIDQYGMNASMNFPPYKPYGTMPQVSVPKHSFTHHAGLPPNHQFHQPQPTYQQYPPYPHQPHFPAQQPPLFQVQTQQPYTSHEQPQYFTHYQHSVPNMNMPPPAFNVPPPGYDQQPCISKQPRNVENPPLPAGSPPKKPPSPPPE